MIVESDKMGLIEEQAGSPSRWTTAPEGHLTDREISFVYQTDPVVQVERVHQSEQSPRVIERYPTETRKNRSIFAEFCLCFSITRNLSSTLATETQEQEVSCLHGLRFLSMSWVILGHTFFFGIPFMDNIKEAQQYLEDFSFQVITQATYSVDTFFFMSGFLVTLILTKKVGRMDRCGAVEVSKQFKLWILFYFNRFLRLAPPLYALVLVFMPLGYYIGWGPLYPQPDESNPLNCHEFWWRDLTFMQNLWPGSEDCIGWSWYVAVDAQWTILTPLLLAPLPFIPVLSYIFLMGVMVASWIVTGVLSKNHNFEPEFPVSASDSRNYNLLYDVIYDKPWTRIGPFIIGLLIGCFFEKIKNFEREKTPGRLVWFLGWLCATVLGLSVIFGLWHSELTPLANQAFLALSRSAWAVACGFVVVACSVGRGGPVGKILGWKAFVPLSRLTYCAYLIHPVVILYVYATRQMAVNVTPQTMSVFFAGNLVLSYAVALLVSCVFEVPFIRMKKLFMPSGAGSV